MTTEAVAALPIDAEVHIQVDWLELTAFLDNHGIARLDQISGVLKIQDEEQNDDIGEADAAGDRLRDDIEAEVGRRAGALQDAYPFQLSEDCEVLSLKSKEDRRGAWLYLLCLILSHATRSPILKLPPKDAELHDVRRTYFQIFSTLAVAGHVGGPAVSLGWPRASGESILSVVARACLGSGTGKPRSKPTKTSNPAAKDGGIDVIGWQPSDRPPPSSYWFGQAASGHKWRDKSARDVHQEFLDDYYEENPRCNVGFVTICPFIVSDADMSRHSLRHGLVLDRTRAPLAALTGIRLMGQHSIDEIARVCRVLLWLGRYRRDVRALI